VEVEVKVEKRVGPVRKLCGCPSV